jgi:hypothetical protein
MNEYMIGQAVLALHDDMVEFAKSNVKPKGFDELLSAINNYMKHNTIAHE